MVMISQSRARRINRNASFDCPIDRGIYDAPQNSPRGLAVDRQAMVERTVRYINRSPWPLSVIDGLGMVMDLPAAWCSTQFLAIRINYHWGHHVAFNPFQTLRQLPDCDPEFVNQIESKVAYCQFTENRNMQVWYKVDVSNADTDTQGVWLEPLNIQIVHQMFIGQTVFFTRECIKPGGPYKEEAPGAETVRESMVHLVYYTRDYRTRNAFIRLGKDVIRVDSTPSDVIEPGLYINLDGTSRFYAADDVEATTNSRSLFVKEEDFNRYGVYACIRDLVREMKMHDKNMPKEYIETFTRFHDMKEQIERQDPRNSKLMVVKMFGGFSLTDIVDLFEALGKISINTKKTID
jgi:hypothetical protein